MHGASHVRCVPARPHHRSGAWPAGSIGSRLREARRAAGTSLRCPPPDRPLPRVAAHCQPPPCLLCPHCTLAVTLAGGAAAALQQADLHASPSLLHPHATRQEAERLGGSTPCGAAPPAKQAEAAEEALAASLERTGEEYVGVKHTQASKGGRRGARWPARSGRAGAAGSQGCLEGSQLCPGTPPRSPAPRPSMPSQAVAALAVAPAYLVLDLSHVQGLDATGARTMGVVHRWARWGGAGRADWWCVMGRAALGTAWATVWRKGCSSATTLTHGPCPARSDLSQQGVVLVVTGASPAIRPLLLAHGVPLPPAPLSWPPEVAAPPAAALQPSVRGSLAGSPRARAAAATGGLPAGMAASTGSLAAEQPWEERRWPGEGEGEAASCLGAPWGTAQGSRVSRHLPACLRSSAGKPTSPPPPANLVPRPHPHHAHTRHPHPAEFGSLEQGLRYCEDQLLEVAVRYGLCQPPSAQLRLEDMLGSHLAKASGMRVGLCCCCGGAAVQSRVQYRCLPELHQPKRTRCEAGPAEASGAC